MEGVDEVVLGHDDRLCLDALLVRLVWRISAEGPVLRDHDVAVLARLVLAGLDDVLATENLCRRLHVELATGELLGLPHLLSGMDPSQRDESCSCPPHATDLSETIERLVTGLCDLIDGELASIYADALRRLDPAPSPSGWCNGEEERS